jgi:hypothetical protein
MSAALSPVPKLQFFTAAGVPLVGGKLYSYAAGTTTPLATYTSSTGGTSNPNPVILDSRGEAAVWLGTPLYKLKLTTAAGAEIWTVDNITSLNDLETSLKAYFAATAGSSRVGFIQAGAGAAARTAQDKLRENLSLKDFGAVGNGVADDTAAVNAWFAAVLATGQTGYAPAGTYKCTSPIVFDYVSKQLTGFTLVGDGVQKTLFTSTVNTALAAAFSIVTSGGSIAVPAIGVYPKISQIGFLSSFGGTTFRVGYTDYSDQQNLVRFETWISNSSDNAAANCLEMNGCYGSYIQYNGGLGTVSAAGDNLRLRKTSFSEFFVSLGSTADISGSPTGTATGVRITDSFNYGNVFLAPDLEILDVAVRIESASAVKTRFIGGTIAGCRTTGVIATAGSDNEFFGVSPNLDPAVPFFGGGANAVGVKRTPTNVLQIEAPSSGGTVSISEFNETLKLTAGTLATLTINLPRNPGDTQRARIQTVGAITALTLGVGRVGDTIFDTVTTLAANSAVEYQYQAGGAQWLRIA